MKNTLKLSKYRDLTCFFPAGTSGFIDKNQEV